MATPVIDRYEIKSMLGKGAMGKVYLAYDPVIARHCAIKTIRLSLLDDPDEQKAYRERFYREARAYGALQHPGAVTIYDIGLLDGNPYIVMEYVDGQVLSERLRESYLSHEEARTLLVGIADVLQAAHKMDIIHRDIKPQNIMIARDGQVKVLDFGIARMPGVELTAADEFWGTPAYAPPEGISERDTDHRGDLYALGVLMYQVITGENLYKTKDLKALFYQILHTQPKLEAPLPHFGIDPAFFKQMMRKATHKEPEGRYQEANDMAADLFRLFSGDVGARVVSMTAPPPSPEPTTQEPTIELPRADTLDTMPVQTVTPAQLQEQQRHRFYEALQEGNIVACRHLLRSFERKGWDCSAEHEQLNRLEAAIAAKEKEKRDKLIAHKREAFEQQIKAGDLDAASGVLEGLRDTGADIGMETRQLAQEKKARYSSNRTTRRKLKAAIAERDLDAARKHLTALKKAGAKVEEIEKEVTALNKDIQTKTARHNQKVKHHRQGFASAMKAGDAVQALSQLWKLRELGVIHTREQDALDLFIPTWAESNKETCREWLEQLPQLWKDKEVVPMRQLLATIECLAPSEIRESAHKYRTKLEAYEAKQEKERIKELLDQLETAIDEDDTGSVHEMLALLDDMEVEDPLYDWLVAKANGEEAGPKPGSQKRLMIGAVVIIIGAGIAWWVLA